MKIRINDEAGAGTRTARGLRKLAKRALRREGVPRRTELSVALIRPERMAELNERYLGRTGPTDVLAFPSDDTGAGKRRRLLGDVALCPAQIEAAHEAYCVEAGRETGYALLHGILHLLNWGHETERENEEMDMRVRSLLKEAD